MEFLDTKLTKDYAIHSLFDWRNVQKTILYSGFKNPYKKSSKQENESLFMNSIL